MELVAALAAFYLGHAVVELSPTATLFRCRRGGRRWIRGRRFVAASLWPGWIDIIGERRLADEPLPTGAYSEASIGAASAPGDGTPLLAGDVPRSLSLPNAEARIGDVVSESRYLGVSNALYLLVVVLVVPLLSLRWHANGAWLLLLPVVGALHLASTAELWRLRGRLLDDPLGGRLSEVVMAFLFPPALLRGRHDVVQTALAGVHPAATAAVVLEGEQLRRYLAGELALLDGLHREQPSHFLALERRGLLEIVRASGWSEADLLRPRRPRDAGAACYCPRCDAEFVAVRDPCPGCRSRTLRYPAAAPA